jgi:hypothetical protein
MHGAVLCEVLKQRSSHQYVPATNNGSEHEGEHQLDDSHLPLRRIITRRGWLRTLHGAVCNEAMKQQFPYKYVSATNGDSVCSGEIQPNILITARECRTINITPAY